MKYIDGLKEGMRVSEVYLCKSKQIALTKTGKEYGRLMLQDKTGMVDAKIWNLNSPGVRAFEAMDYVRVDGDVSVFMGANQLNVERIRKADEGEYVRKIICRYPRRTSRRCTKVCWRSSLQLRILI